MNDSMGGYVATETVKMMIQKDVKVKGGNVLILGITFKENCPDIRNTKVIDVIDELKKYNLNIDVYDPWANAEEVAHEFNISLVREKSQLKTDYDAVILTVSHHQFANFQIENYCKENAVVFDVKSFLPIDKIDGRL